MASKNAVRYRGVSSGMPPVSRFRSGHMPTGMSVTTAIDSLSESDMDTCSDSDNECYGGRYSLEASPQDDKIPMGGGGPRQNGFLNGGRGRGFASAYRGFADDDDESESVTSSEVNSTSTGSNYASVLERKFRVDSNFAGTSQMPNKESLKQVRIYPCS